MTLKASPPDYRKPYSSTYLGFKPMRVALRKGARSVVPLADRAIGNRKQWLIGTHHGVSRGQLQVCLDEFVLRHNRRKTPMAAFQTLLGLGTARNPTPYDKMRDAVDLSVNTRIYRGWLKQPDKQKSASTIVPLLASMSAAARTERIRVHSYSWPPRRSA
jgi:hypothetical protein